MGQPVTVVQKTTSRPDVVRFEINRSITGMDPHRYVAGEEIDGTSPPDEVARRLLAKPGVEGVHVYSNVITVDGHRLQKASYRSQNRFTSSSGARNRADTAS